MKRRPVAHRAHRTRARAASRKASTPFKVRYSSPPALFDPKSYSHVVEVEGARLLFVSGQVPVNAQRQLTSKDLREQVARVYDNIEAVLRSVGAGFEHVIKTNNYLTNISQTAVFREVRDQRFGRLATKPASTTVVVTALVDPDYLLEIEVIAAVPAR
ncbi:MAG TPA: RidA family protein [Burkholderiales bacterium]|nr:RidA family protein [Burkholderiales bacterium]